MSSPSTRRLLKESTDLHKNPSPYFTAAPISDSNLHDWHFTLAGPPSPSPLRPRPLPRSHHLPSYISTSPALVPLLNALRPISGHHEETWQPAWGVRTALLGIRSEIFSSESQGQVGGMEGNDELRREYARLSLGWRCRECGVENLEAMKELWRICRERGIEVEGEVEGVSGAGVEGQRETAEAEADAQAPTSSGHDAPVGAEDQGPAGGAVESPPAAETVSAPSAPAPVPAVQAQAQAQAQSQLSTVQAPGAADIPTQTGSPQLASTESPSEGVWLDRAIIGVVIALVLLILRRVANVDDL
ncbi:uncharacterized protein N7500_001088 [Penicillium coprophilum]|uniref:uncharacterized protein n=1 Tax=Penicillium coprophilum TaxID=36646 RepID=UPI00238C132B|nr:uncharacterized protein N7500_001088 [Penicillium coprophilum]KAJ5178389.1 hypothetical protein N7500_001088 [Penicillium coprophilum]